jgi:hypothetical protein
MATIDSDAQLAIHVFGASQGESIVLRLPDGGWGVVDCYASTLNDPSDNPTCQFLAERGVTELEFLCLTHPHDDHFRGMSRLLDEFSVRCFWRPSVMSGERLKWLLKLSLLDAARSGNEKTVEDANELERVFTLIRDARRKRTDPIILKNAAVGTLLYPVPVDPSAGFQIWSVAPSGRQTDRYEDGLRKCFDSSGRMCDRLPYSRHNEISMALLVVFGETRVVLGGDVETSGWSDSIKEFGVDKLSAVAVKVSHHGSTNGYCDGLWQAFAKDGKPIAILTPFRRHGLPKREGLEHIREFAQRILTPSLAAIPSEELPIPLSSKAPVQSRKALRDTFKARARSSDYPPGRCSLVFDNHGNCVERIVDPPAGEISSNKANRWYENNP